jgi:SM-20-related protein
MPSKKSDKEKLGQMTIQRLPESAEKLVVTKVNIGGLRNAYIIDNVLPKKLRAKIFNVFKKLPYQFLDSDRTDTTYIKHLVHQFSENDWHIEPLNYIKEFGLDFLRKHRHKTKQVSRIYANFNLHGDVQMAHDDGDKWTILAFLNNEWNEDWGGEFLLYADKTTDLSLAIPVKPGRVIVFDGKILHRGGVPNKLCFEPRITLAIKIDR